MGIELTTVDAVKSWLSGTGKAPAASTDDDNIQACIVMWSWIFMWKVGLGADGDVPEVNPFNEPVEFNEWYDGTGHGLMFLRNNPIQSVISLNVSGRSIPLAPNYSDTGVMINSAKDALIMRGGPGVGYGSGGFDEGVQNINIVYTAGYKNTPPDIERACVIQVALTYKRRDWIGLKSKTMAGGAGTTSYQDYECEPVVEAILNNYKTIIPI
jgi:hypothetical protein